VTAATIGVFILFAGIRRYHFLCESDEVVQRSAFLCNRTEAVRAIRGEGNKNKNKNKNENENENENENKNEARKITY